MLLDVTHGICEKEKSKNKKILSPKNKTASAPDIKSSTSAKSRRPNNAGKLNKNQNATLPQKGVAIPPKIFEMNKPPSTIYINSDPVSPTNSLTSTNRGARFPRYS